MRLEHDRAARGEGGRRVAAGRAEREREVRGREHGDRPDRSGDAALVGPGRGRVGPGGVDDRRPRAGRRGGRRRRPAAGPTVRATSPRSRSGARPVSRPATSTRSAVTASSSPATASSRSASSNAPGAPGAGRRRKASAAAAAAACASCGPASGTPSPTGLAVAGVDPREHRHRRRVRRALASGRASSRPRVARRPGGRRPADDRADELDDDTLLRWRLRSQRLTGPGSGSDAAGLAAAVAWSGAVQAQDHEPALWSLVRRSGCPPLTVASAAFDAGDFVRTHVLRPTWHLVPPDRLFALLALTGPRLLRSLATRWRDLGLDPPVLARAADAARAALADRGPLTRAELGGVFERSGVGIEGQRLPHLLMHAELRGVVCSGPMRGREHTYVPAEERVPAGAAPLDEVRVDDVARELARDVRALARPGDGAGPGVVGRAARGRRPHGPGAAARPALRHPRARPAPYWRGGGAPDGTAEAGGRPAVHLLQGFDEYVVAYSESRGLADPHGAAGADAARAGCSRRSSRSTGASWAVGGGGCCVPRRRDRRGRRDVRRAARAACARRARARRPSATRQPWAGRCGSSSRSDRECQIQEGSHIRSAQDGCGMSSAT